MNWEQALTIVSVQSPSFITLCADSNPQHERYRALVVRVAERMTERMTEQTAERMPETPHTQPASLLSRAAAWLRTPPKEGGCGCGDRSGGKP